MEEEFDESVFSPSDEKCSKSDGLLLSMLDTERVVAETGEGTGAFRFVDFL